MRHNHGVHYAVAFARGMFVMVSNPWDVQPWSGVGDKDPSHLFMQVGAALTAWETLEAEMGELFDALVASGNRAGFVAYIAVISPTSRAEMLRAATDVALKKVPALRIDVVGFLHSVRQFVARRNEITHGRVFNLGEYGFCLGPNNTMPRKFRNGRASYQWVAIDVEYYSLEFAKLCVLARELRDRVKAV